MKRNELIPVLLAGLTAFLGGGWLAARRLPERRLPFRRIAGGPWWMFFLLALAGISLVVFLTYAFAFAFSVNITVI